jgi:hypothetical protein
MSSWVQIWFKRIRLWGAILAIAGGSNGLLSAGEPIIFGKEKSKADPVKDTKFGKEISKPWESLPDEATLNGIVPILPRSAPLDPKKDKRRIAELKERKNWMQYDRGELQDKAEDEEEQFGVRDYNLDESEKDDGTVRDLTFRDMGRNRGQFRSPGQSRPSSQQQRYNASQAAQQQRDREDAETEAKRDARAKLDLRGTGESVFGNAGQLNLKGWLEVGAIPNADRGESSSNDPLKTGAVPGLSREQQARREDFKNFLNGPSSGNPLPGASDALNQRSDFTRQINPGFAKPAEPIVRTGEDPNLFRPGANPYADAYNLPVDAYSPSRTPGFLPSPLLRPADVSRPSFSFEPPKMTGRAPGGHRQ